MATSIFSRKRDLVYLVHFCIGLPLMFLVDLQSLYPAHLVPSFMVNLKSYYISTYNDLFFISPPPFFKLYMWSELLYQAPVMLWAIPNLYNNSPKVPLVLLPFSCLIFITTLTCMIEYSFWSVPLQQKLDLSTLYGPYLALSAFMGIDMYGRISGVIDGAAAVARVKESKKLR
ncbi:hypothetical protein M430DRAFT_47954 [Amorphotheca resinae ATCC 22711]|uniref:Efficient mitochondria targeting-associated protein 19 n=1 Tax=Amorphotheca resinae ATCC 22711 TaxID=857342 RepID=A0A2T3BAZ3_AMORE|nr:hypothetical protein M430DRAFT_47954 [Amorphotheca resinae ATCC 22711]PSS25507.1 hypothetical protein M430DRAFT_47954 [Amorphotheca resinae ATCC 22711]